MKFINDLNLKKQASDLGIKVWQTPGFLFIMMGVVAAIAMTGTYYMSKNYDDPQLLVIAESAVAITILIIGNVIVGIVEQVTNLNKAKSEFVSVASHQLRTPLSAIRWETELLLTKMKKGLTEKQISNIENIAEQSRKMARLVNDLLDVARIDQDRLILRHVSVDIGRISEEAVKSLAPILKAKGIGLAFSSSRKSAKVLGDPEKIRMVIENLLGNASKYTINEGKIEVKVSQKDGSVVFSVKDNGVGIPKEQQKRIFEKFFRSDNIVKYQTEGTGLGLYIAKNVIEQLGGNIEFDSVEGLGTIFSFSLPAARHE
ncbi:MAG: HAMP domain-containing histidine kinase [Candidatus Moranbacteria bacterium]|nr:HAMP domain-containing histidine kinase [Candidatus Moranbacteria bacterium]